MILPLEWNRERSKLGTGTFQTEDTTQTPIRATCGDAFFKVRDFAPYAALLRQSSKTDRDCAGWCRSRESSFRSILAERVRAVKK